ncbi:EVE domain-containing protein [Stygiolobus caldivivus]|uniref:EVE domain-containing protein n=1 Tax=Stygiolobus caldivivus TaxID=2824673 RepID=A0A8D5U7E3_9CREN|nr:EVE domain-containing protein [Stygiolobus caldivivus]BCU70430.1 EVE domain-containing protein [Stygiolobus caldivivus]
MAYWIIPVQEDFWEAILSINIYGYNKESIKQYVKKGDGLIFYVNKYYAKKYGGKFVGIYSVISDWYTDSTILFPEEKIKNRPIYIYRVKLEKIVVGECSSKDIIEKVHFIEDKYQFSKYLRNVPANLKRPIPLIDVQLIEQCLKESILL